MSYKCLKCKYKHGSRKIMRKHIITEHYAKSQKRGWLSQESYSGNSPITALMKNVSK